MKIQALKVENFKKIRKMEITSDRGIVILGGKNGAGKTSALDAIQIALCGTSSMPRQPLREGENKAVIEVDLGEVTVKRTITRKDDGTFGGSLSVATKAGMKPGAAQTWLNQRIGDLSCDPLAFMLGDDKTRANLLRRVANVDTSALDTQRLAIEAERREIGRQAQSEDAKLKGMPFHGDVPDRPVAAEEISVASVMHELDEARRTNASYAEAQIEAARRLRELSVCENRLHAAEEEVKSLQEKLRAAMDARDQRLAALDETKAALQAAEAHAESLQSQRIDEAPIRARLSALDETNRAARHAAAETNRKIQANKTLKTQIELVASLKAEYARKTEELRAIDSAKADMLASAKMPVPGLGFDDAGGVTFDGLPLDQASGAQKLRISMAMALAANPEIRVVLIRDASLLDEDSLALVTQMAEEADAQVWLERVGTTDPGAVVIVDGEVVA